MSNGVGKFDKVVVMRGDLDAVERARKRIYKEIFPLAEMGTEDDTGLLALFTEITAPIWYIGNRNFPTQQSELTRLTALLEKATDALAEIREIYAGSEHCVPDTALEADQQWLIDQMCKVAADSLAEIREGKS